VAEQTIPTEQAIPTEQTIPADELTGVPGLEDWSVLVDAAYARYRTTSLTQALALAARAGERAVAADVPLRLDLRPDGVTCAIPVTGLAEFRPRDRVLAREIGEVARTLGAAPDPHGPQQIEIAVDALDGPAVQAFWRALLGHEPLDLGWGDRERFEGGPAADPLRDPHRRLPAVWFQQTTEVRPQRNRLHVDVHLPLAVAAERVAAAVAAGGRVLHDEDAPMFWVLADPEGNEACVCGAPGAPPAA
jgi:4a-hydroxytetrahydrobiopterin dehydratase